MQLHDPLHVKFYICPKPTVFKRAMVILSLKSSYSLSASGRYKVREQVDAVGRVKFLSQRKRMHGCFGNPRGGGLLAPVTNANILSGVTGDSSAIYIYTIVIKMTMQHFINN